ncbi:TPA: hypothetical protein MI358_10225 [Klebsiella pneumoniae]|nr:hypothetical protein [Klebsiella pneumoniae]ROD38962.1 hypothetical protein C4Z13_013860 [Klebsiella pneumoniae subsp. pneumoniae]HBX3294442.1 hypothetical protein [Klebsiella pneumoniae]HBY6112716.1 hypothetical protein [Klebsiella pneumoniae]HBY6128391.1 hypothetical protein [Klebsiella pneumoniae]
MVWVLSFLQRVVRIKALDATVLSQYRSIHSGETIVSPIFLHAGQFTAKGSYLFAAPGRPANSGVRESKR